jgi:hypothetical protein
VSFPGVITGGLPCSQIYVAVELRFRSVVICEDMLG